MILKRLCPLAMAFACLLFVLFGFPARARAAQARVIDDMGYLTSSQIEKLEHDAEVFVSRFDTDVFVLIMDEYGFSDNYARDYIEEYGVTMYPQGYVGFMVNMADRSYWVDAYGDEARSIVTQSVADNLADDAFDHLSDGEYFEACEGFIKDLAKVYEIKTEPFGFVHKLWLYPVRTLIVLPLAGVLAVLAAWGMTFAKANKHKDKKLSYHADLYRTGYTRLPGYDNFVRFYETRVRKAESSGGGGHGGGGSAGHTGSGGHF